MKFNVLLALIISLCPLFVEAETRFTGDIDGSSFIVDVPSKPSGDVLFLARGYRPNSLPLSAVYEKENTFFQTLLTEGWTIASPSFGGNRWVMADGAADLIALRAHVNKNIVSIKRAFLYGETMGGGITALLAEQSPEGFDGAISLGAHHYAEPQGEVPDNPKLAAYLPGKPKFPIVLLSNDGEVHGSRLYAQRAINGKYPPVLWTVSRSGHVNLNSAERLSALRAVIAWSETGIRPDNKTAMLVMDPPSTAEFKNASAAGMVTRTRPLYGNIYTNFVADDLSKLGIKLGDTFAFTHKDETVSATFASAYSDVELGEWVAFIDPESYVQVSRNYENATQTLGVKTGDALLISEHK